MSAIKDAIGAMRDVLLLTERVEQTGKVLSELAKELREHDRRLVRLETMVEMARATSGKRLPRE